MRSQPLTMSAWIPIVAAFSLLIAACGQPARPGAATAPGQQPAGSAAASTATNAFAAAKTMTLDELYQKALQEGGTLAYYGSLAQVNAEKILPMFEERFPGIKVEHIDATADKLVARVITEARGGKTLADVFSTSMEYVYQVNQQGLLLQALPPEAMAYPENLRGQYWVATDLQSIVASWNTNLVRPDETPRQFEDFADPKWKNRLAAEPRDVELLIALTKKLGSEERAIEVLRQIAANNVEFHRGHSELADYITAGQAAVCITCYSHHYPPRIRRGAPVDYMLSEGIGLINATAVLKDAPHPYTAMLWYRWVTAEEGQHAYVEGGRTGAHPNVQPKEKTRPDVIYSITVDDIANQNRYLRTWNEIFGLR